MKKVLLIIVDALASRVVRPAMEEGRLPNLQQLAEAGAVHWDSTAIFPSITPAATAALVTGGYPTATGVSGAYFYDRDSGRVHYYGDDIWAVLQRGFSTFFRDFLVRLNRDQLRIDTAFERVERAGLRAACLNLFWYRGQVPHRVHVPWLLRLWPGVPSNKTINGPAILSLGDFVSDMGGSGRKTEGPGGALKRFGFCDDNTAAALLQLAKDGTLPDFTVAYFPNNDFDSHSEGPADALADVENVDRVLGELADSLGGMQAMLQSLAVVVTGDHSQTDLPFDSDRTGIELDSLLENFSIVPAGRDWRGEDDLMICPNLRAAQIYVRRAGANRHDEIVSTLLADERIDQVMWRNEGNRPPQYCVQTQRHGRLEFAPGAQDRDSAADEYGNVWNWRGSLVAVDGRVNNQGVLEFGDYPNAFERIACAFDEDVSGDLWVTSKPGYEFRIAGTEVHRGGSHGSLHAYDSLSPLIVAGVPDEARPTKTPRSVDVTPLCLSVLGIEAAHPVGAGHVNVQGTRQSATS